MRERKRAEREDHTTHALGEGLTNAVLVAGRLLYEPLLRWEARPPCERRKEKAEVKQRSTLQRGQWRWRPSVAELLCEQFGPLCLGRAEPLSPPLSLPVGASLAPSFPVASERRTRAQLPHPEALSAAARKAAGGGGTNTAQITELHTWCT